MPLSEITREAVLQAMVEYNRLGQDAFLEKYGYDQSKRYRVRHNGRVYDSKAIAGVAHGFLPGREPLRASDFTGGLATVVRELSALGFAVETDEPGETVPGLRSLREPLENVLIQFAEARNHAFGTRPDLWAAFENVRAALEEDPSIQSRPDLKVKWSPGAGNWARVPWISILDTRATTSTQQGVYVVYLFREDMSGVYLTLNQGVTQPKKEMGAAEGRAWLTKMAQSIREQLLVGALPGFSLDNKIDLRSGPGLGSDYEVSTIAYKFYEGGSIASDADLRDDLRAVITAYQNVADEEAPMQVEGGEPVGSLAPVVDSFARGLREANISFGSRHDEIVRSFIASMATKRFVILTGLSGSGKTQLAIQFGRWLGDGRWHLEPVRPDWTGAESVLGFVDALQPAKDGHQAWHVPKVLSFMLHAARDPVSPYLLVLDEMNLAHVERYFADVLSGMESDTPVLPNLAKDDDGQWRTHVGASGEIPIPRNLFIVGTVNVDETTYMFSPKVLDRANVFEFRVDTGDLELTYEKPGHVDDAPAALVDAFITVAGDDTWQLIHPASELSEFSERLRQVHAVLAASGLEFGHRVFYEALRFAALFESAGDPSWERALDLQVMQKVLPRLHGSRRQLEPMLSALGHYAYDFSVDSSDDPNAQAFDLLVALSQQPALPVSFDKLRRMTRNVRANQFASFTD